MNAIQQRFEGFLNTPVLWKGKDVYNLAQFEIDAKTISFDVFIDQKLRLGKYVERFVSHQLLKDNSIDIIAENIQIVKDKITLGELDCLLLKNDTPIHLELIYKFYLFDPTPVNNELEHWIGPNRKDSLIEKLEKLSQKQLPLLYSLECREYLQSIHLSVEKIIQQVYFKAQLFVPLLMDKKIDFKINSECIVGFYINTSELKQFENAKFFIPNKKDWLVSPHVDVDWLPYDTYVAESKEYLQGQFSPMCWMKTVTGELEKFFLVWW